MQGPAPSRSWLQRSQTSEHAAHPRAGRPLWARAFLAPAPPPRLPAPQRAGAARGAFEPGAPLRGSPGAEDAPSTAAPQRTQHGKGRGRYAGGCSGVWAGTAAGRPREHTHSHTDRGTLAFTLPLLAALLPQDLQLPPLIKGCAEGCSLSAQGPRESGSSRCSPNDTSPSAKALAVLYTRDSGHWLVSLPLPGARSQWV